MKTFFRPVLLSCLVSLFVFNNRAMAQRYVQEPARREQRIPPSPSRIQPSRHNGRAVPAPSGRNDRIQPAIPQLQPPRVQSPQSPLPPSNIQIAGISGNGTIVHRTQTTVVRGIPGVLKLPHSVSQGLWLGIGTANHPGGGVCVTDVLPDSPGDYAGFEVDDVVLEINGTPIHDIQDYSNAVDDSPKTMDVTVVNLYDIRINRTVELRY